MTPYLIILARLLRIDFTLIDKFETASIINANLDPFIGITAIPYIQLQKLFIDGAFVSSILMND